MNPLSRASGGSRHAYLRGVFSTSAIRERKTPPSPCGQKNWKTALTGRGCSWATRQARGRSGCTGHMRASNIIVRWARVVSILGRAFPRLSLHCHPSIKKEEKKDFPPGALFRNLLLLLYKKRAAAIISLPILQNEAAAVPSLLSRLACHLQVSVGALVPELSWSTSQQRLGIFIFSP